MFIGGRESGVAPRRLVRLAGSMLVWIGCGGQTATPGGQTEATPPDPLLVAEDGRSTDESSIAPLLQALSEGPEVRMRAVRGLGRMEDPGLIQPIQPLLSDPDPRVRREAVNAVGQAASRGDAGEALTPLSDLVESEQDPIVVGTIGRTVGRLSFVDTEIERGAEVLSRLATRLPVAQAPTEALVELALGFEALYRTNPGTGPDETALDWLAEASVKGRTIGGGGDDVSGRARLRRTASSALAAGGVTDPAVWGPAMSDPDGQVRRIAVGAVAGTSDARLGEQLRQALSDPDPNVRIQALTSYSVTFRASRGCEPLLLAARERVTRVALVALDLLGAECAEASRQRTTLSDIARTLDDGRSWHRAAHALVSLASIDPDRGRRALAPFASHESPFVRAYGARGAALVGDGALLVALMDDEADNVREAAVRGLFALEGHGADSIAAAQLSRDDPQLVLTAAQLLEGSPTGPAWVDAVLSSLDRLTSARRETSRDPRTALLLRAREFGDPSLVPRLEPYLGDFDPTLAELAAETIGEWTQRPARAAPSAPPRLPLPTPGDIERLTRTRVILEMRRGGQIGIALFPELAPTNAARFERMAETGYLDGLTFHRMVPNFVIQGGSPGANEYWGDGPFTRDEVGLVPHWRGTVGVSTRGRDTADGQLFVNLIDNVRLNHAYTVFGEVVVGMDVVDNVLEGDVIERARVIRGRSR